jgi:hypothetical protein
MRQNKIYRAMLRNQVRATIAAAIIGSAIIACTAINKVTSSDYTAWDIYCAEYQVDNDCPTEEQENYFLDAFVGSGECDSLSMVYNGYIINGIN